jgi:hypothetical protein
MPMKHIHEVQAKIHVIQENVKNILKNSSSPTTSLMDKSKFSNSTHHGAFEVELYLQ